MEEPIVEQQRDPKETERTRAELASKWELRIKAAERVKKEWMMRFDVIRLYEYFEGYQWTELAEDRSRPYVVNLIYSTIENKLPNMVFDNPSYTVRPRPMGTLYDEESASRIAQIKEDALNYISSRDEFGLNDKHELATLDAFFGFGVLECSYSDDPVENPALRTPVDKVYCKHIPFDTFVVSANANWDLSRGRWYGYWEWVPLESLEKYGAVIVGEGRLYDEAGIKPMMPTVLDPENSDQYTPEGCAKIYHVWDFETSLRLLFIPDAVTGGNRLAHVEKFERSPISILRFGKRRVGWYPIPPVFNWIAPQEEINDIRQTQRAHRRRFTRKYVAITGKIEQPEVDKIVYGADGTIAWATSPDAIAPVPDLAQDSAASQSLVVSYDDLNRVSGTPDEQRGVTVSNNRTTATQASILDKRAQIRESRDLLRVANFMVQVGKAILHAFKSADSEFWVLANRGNEPVLGAVQQNNMGWKRIPPQIFQTVDEHDINLNITSISPVYQEQDKKALLEFMALITQYEIMSFSPALFREAAYKCGYRNERVLGQFQQLAQLASLGRLKMAKAQVAQISSPQPTAPGMLPQQQVEASTPSDNDEIMNAIFNRQGVQG